MRIHIEGDEELSFYVDYEASGTVTMQEGEPDLSNIQIMIVKLTTYAGREIPLTPELKRAIVQELDQDQLADLLVEAYIDETGGDD